MWLTIAIYILLVVLEGSFAYLGVDAYKKQKQYKQEHESKNLIWIKRNALFLSVVNVVQIPVTAFLLTTTVPFLFILILIVAQIGSLQLVLNAKIYY